LGEKTNRLQAARRSGRLPRRPKGPSGRTREQLYNDAKKLGIEGRSKMSRKELQHAVAGAS